MARSPSQIPDWSRILPVTVEVRGIQIEFLMLRIGVSPHKKRAESKRPLVVYEAIWKVPGCPPKTFKTDLRRTYGQSELTADVWVRVVHEAFNWLVHTFDLNAGENYWAPPLPTRQAARRIFGLNPYSDGLESRNQPDGQTPDLPLEMFNSAALAALGERPRTDGPEPAQRGVAHVGIGGVESPPDGVAEGDREIPIGSRGDADELVTEVHEQPGPADIVQVYGDVEADDAEYLRFQQEVLAAGEVAIPVGIQSPEAAARTATVYKTSMAVREFVLRAANGRCEGCGSGAAFVKESGLEYWELHHVQPLAELGPDIIENTVCLCPNCHRALHFSADKAERREALFASVGRLGRR